MRFPGKAISNLFSGGSSTKIPAPIALPQREDPDVQRARDSEQALRKRRASSGTILTGGLGDTTDAPVKQKTLGAA